MREIKILALIAIMVLADGCGPPPYEPEPLQGPPLISSISDVCTIGGMHTPEQPAGSRVISAYVGVPYRLSAGLSTGKEPVLWLWEISGATPDSCTEQGVNLTPVAVGNFTCQVTATNKLGSDIYDFTLNVVMPPLPTYSDKWIYLWPGFPATIGRGDFYEPDYTHIQYWSWDFGGACSPNLSTTQDTEVIAGAPGIYHGNVTVSNASGSNTYDVTVSVKELIAPELPQQDQVLSGYTGRSTHPTWPNSGGPATSWSWNLGGAGTPATSTEESPVMHLGAPETYHGTVMASNAIGSATAPFTIEVLPLPAFHH